MKKRLLFSIVTCTLFAGGLMAQYADFPFDSDVKGTQTESMETTTVTGPIGRLPLL